MNRKIFYPLLVLFVCLCYSNPLHAQVESDSLLSVKGGYHLYDYDGKMLNTDEIENILKICPDALNNWQSSIPAQRANLAMKIVTPVTLVTSVVLFNVGFFHFWHSGPLFHGYFNFYKFIPGLHCVVIGDCLLLVGITAGVMIPVTRNLRNKRVKEAADMYNEYVHAKTKTSLNFGVTPSGNVGFLLKF